MTIASLSLIWDKYDIKPVIDIRNMWRDKEETRTLESGRYQNMTHDYKGTIFCHCPKTGVITKMVYGGFEEDRETLSTCALHCNMELSVQERLNRNAK